MYNFENQSVRLSLNDNIDNRIYRVDSKYFVPLCMTIYTLLYRQYSCNKNSTIQWL